MWLSTAALFDTTAFRFIAKLGVCLCLVSSADASLVGDEVFKVETPQGFNQNFGNDGPAIVADPGVEYVGGSGSLDLTADSIIWHNRDHGAWRLSDFRDPPVDGFIKLWELTSLDWVGVIGEIIGIDITSDHSYTNSDAEDWFRFDAHSVAFGFPADKPIATVTYANPGLTTIVLRTRHGTPVPEPTTILLLGLGLAGLGFARKRLH